MEVASSPVSEHRYFIPPCCPQPVPLCCPERKAGSAEAEALMFLHPAARVVSSGTVPCVPVNHIPCPWWQKGHPSREPHRARDKLGAGPSGASMSSSCRRPCPEGAVAGPCRVQPAWYKSRFLGTSFGAGSAVSMEEVTYPLPYTQEDSGVAVEKPKLRALPAHG